MEARNLSESNVGAGTCWTNPLPVPQTGSSTAPVHVKDRRGGRKTFLPFALPHITQAEIDEVVDTLRSGWLTTGPKTKRFEREFAERIGAPYAVAVNSATAAMHLALDAIGLQPGDEVLVPVYTFTATAEVVTYFGARPVFVDVDPVTCNLDPTQLEKHITARTRAIMVVHIAGLPAELDAIHAIAKAHKLPVIEDAAHAFPAQYRGRMIGTISDLTAFSFYVTKTLATGEGGMLTTANPEYAERATMMALHGISRDAWKRYTAEGSWYYEVLQAGYKYNMTDIAAALGLHQLARSEWLWERRRAIALRYTEAFSQWPELEPPPCTGDKGGVAETSRSGSPVPPCTSDKGGSRVRIYPARTSRSGSLVPPNPDHVEHAWHLYLLRLRTERLAISRDAFIQELTKANIGTSVHFIPLHLHPFYRDTYQLAADDFPAALDAYRRVISLPIYPGLTDEDVEDVIAAVEKIITTHRK